MAEREQGTVKWFDDTKGYGFIQRDGGGDIFVHYKSILMHGFKTLSDGQRVEFLVQEGPKGPHASQVVPVYTEGASWASEYT